MRLWFRLAPRAGGVACGAALTHALERLTPRAPHTRSAQRCAPPAALAMSDNPFLADSIAAGGGVWGRPPAVPPPPTAPAATGAPPPVAAAAAASARDNPFAAEEDDAMFTMQPPSPKPLPPWAGGPSASLPRSAALAAEARAGGSPPSPAPRPASAMGVAESLYAGMSTDEVARELATRERALAAREAALQRRENEMAEALRRLKPHNCACRQATLLRIAASLACCLRPHCSPDLLHSAHQGRASFPCTTTTSRARSPAQTSAW